MTDVDLSVEINRDALALDPLILGDGNPYYIATQFLGAGVTWDRQQVSSRWVDGDFTTSRRRANVTEQIAVEVVCPDMFTLQNAVETLIDAFVQDFYLMTTTVDGQLWTYQCEAADYQNAMWNTPRLAACQGQIIFSVPRRPVAVSGAY